MQPALKRAASSEAPLGTHREGIAMNRNRRPSSIAALGFGIALMPAAVALAHHLLDPARGLQRNAHLVHREEVGIDGRELPDEADHERRR